ncbi:hypothetical protein MW887_002600 [Aspergillus wentii]|nr:hypothetical protein MW887_002600 [Aspergillus wentii]
MPFFTRVFRNKDSGSIKKATKSPVVEEPEPEKPTWTDAWQRAEIAPEEVQDLLRGCTQELKLRALDTPFLLLPFRPSSDPSAARSFIRNYFNQSVEKGSPLSGDALAQELRLSDPMVLCSVMKWCWSRLPGGVVTWEAYELFKVGEQDSQLARDAFSTFIPISVDSDARTKIIFDFFDLLTAIAAHGKSNGLGGRKLSRYAGWWAFEHVDTGNGFEGSYKSWASAADATSHLFFAYLRSISPDSSRGMSGISTLPIALQSLVQATEYPPETPTLLQVSTTKVVMVVDTVSPTPFALLRRAKNFEYRDSDRHLQEFASFEDPTRALTDECQRVLKCISSTNQSSVASQQDSTNTQDASWSRFEDIGFGNSIEGEVDEDVTKARNEFGLKSAPRSGGGDLGRPTTPSWADFMSSGFSDENVLKAPVTPMLLPPDKILPPLSTGRGQSSQSHKRTLDADPSLEPGELANIATLDLDDSFWWVWISSLAGEESASRKAVFGRCALVETVIKDTKWLVLEEQVKGAASEPEPGAYIVEKKRFFGLSTRKGKLSRRQSTARKATPMEESYKRPNNQAPQSKTSIGPDQHARIQAAAAALQKKNREQEQEANGGSSRRRDQLSTIKTNSVMTLQPGIVNEASQAMKWASNYDKNAYRSAYLNDTRAGTGTLSRTLSEALQSPSTDKLDVPGTPTSTSTRQAPAPLCKDASPHSPPPPAPATPTKSVVEPSNDVASSRKGSTSIAAEQIATESQPKQSTDSVEDPGRKLKKKPGNAGFKSMFGSMRRSDTSSKPPMKATGAEPSAVAAARAALEGKAKASQEQSSRPPTNGSSVLKKKPLPENAAVNIPLPDDEKPATPKVTETSVPEPEVDASKTPTSPVGSPRTRRDAEYDALSRVDTNERAAADKEFSRFDQGPLVEQPAFVPDDSPVSPVTEDPHENAPLEVPEKAPSRFSERFTERNSERFSIPIMYQAEPTVEPPLDDSPRSPVSRPSQDRWAQIRKNAADRAAQAQQAEPRLSEDPTDDGDTSGEEAIESRVARIKARVAELTGNMEAAR